MEAVCRFYRAANGQDGFNPATLESLTDACSDRRFMLSGDFWDSERNVEESIVNAFNFPGDFKGTTLDSL
jgi:hypothetical protein